MFADLFNKKIIFVSGKGGTGKSVVTALLGLLAAQAGKKVLIAESHAFDKLSPLFGRGPLGHHETEVSEGVTCINLDAKHCLAEYITLHLGMEGLYDRVFRSKPVSSLLDAIPGLDETMLLGRLFHTCELAHKFDLLIFDSPASGHFLNLLATPDAIINSGLVGPLVREVVRVRNFLSDPEKATSVVVTLPEPLVMTETFEFAPVFNNTIPLHLSAIILNRAYATQEEQFTPAIQKYFDRKQNATKQALEDLKTYKEKNPSFLKNIYSFPDLEIIEEPITVQKLIELLPFIQEIASEPR